MSVRLAPGWEGAMVARRRAQPPRDAAGGARFLPLVWELLFEAGAGTQEFVINDPSGSPRSRRDIPALISHSWSEVSGPAAGGERERGRAGGRRGACGVQLTPAISRSRGWRGGRSLSSHPPTPPSTGTTPGPPVSSSLFLIRGQAGREGSPGARRAKKSLVKSQALAGESAERGEETSPSLEAQGGTGAALRQSRERSPHPEAAGVPPGSRAERCPPGGTVARFHQPQPAKRLLLRACGRRGGRRAARPRRWPRPSRPAPWQGEREKPGGDTRVSSQLQKLLSRKA